MRFARIVLRGVGAGLLLATGAIHLDLYLTGYRSIPTIGWLFLLQVIAAFGLGLGVLAIRSRVLAAAGAMFSLSTLAGYLLSLRVGLFGFREVRTTAGIVAGIVEVTGTAVLAWLALPAPRTKRAGHASAAMGMLDRVEPSIPVVRRLSGALVLLAAVLFGVSVGASGPAATTNGSGSVLIKVAKINGVPVLTNARGFTLYWFVPDPPNKSTCYGTCAVYWPPVPGGATAGAGVSGKLGTIRRTGGGTETTYDGRPLYTYVGDSAPGQAKGDNINLNGGVWHGMTASGH